MIRRPPRSTLDRSSAASDVYKRQGMSTQSFKSKFQKQYGKSFYQIHLEKKMEHAANSVSYTHLRAHETVLDLVCRLLLETKKKK